MPKAATARRRRSPLALLVPLGLLLVVGLLAIVLLRPTPPKPPPPVVPPAATCPDVPTVVVAGLIVPAGPIAGYCQPQLANAAQIIAAADSLDISPHGKELGVMTAIGESGLRNLDFGDKVGPDSRGLFQQRSNYGPVAIRMNPYVAARHFYFRMLGLPGWQTRAPTVVAHAVQGNADPDYYTPFWPRAKTLVRGLYCYQLFQPRRVLLP